MLIREWLRRLPPDAAARFAASPPWNAVAADRDWAALAADPDAVSRAAAALPEETAAALKTALIRFGSLPFEPEQFGSAAAGDGLPSGVAARELERLRAAGIVFTVRKTWGDRLHFIASDALAAWTAALLPLDVRPLPDDRRAARPLQDYTEPLGLQLLQMFAELAKRGAELAAGAGMTGRTAASAAARLSFGSEALRAFEARLAAGRAGDAADPRIAFGLAAAAHLGLLGEAGGRTVWRRDALARWLAMEANRRERELLAFATDRLAACDERFMHAGALLRSLEGGRWYPAAGIEAWLARHAPAAAEHWRDWVGTLTAFGWMQTGRSAAGEPVVRWLIDPRGGAETKAGDRAPDGRIRFMPGAELAVPPDLDWRLRWELELVADKAKPGPMGVMRLSAVSYARWVENGRTAGEALALLEEAAGCPVPDDLGRSIREWDESAGRMGFREALLLVCDDARIADRAASEPPVAGLLGERIGERHFLVDPRHAAELRRRLAKAGIPARSGMPETDGPERPRYPFARDPGPDGGAADAPAPESPGDAVMAKAVRLLSGLQLERYAPDLEIRPPAASDDPSRRERPSAPSGAGRTRAAAGGEGDRMRAIRATGLPAHWFGALRRVHPSTRREMVKRAIEIGAAVRIVRDGAEMDILPERLEETDGGWRMIGRPAGSAADPSSRVALDGDSWSEMRLLLPEWIGERK